MVWFQSPQWGSNSKELGVALDVTPISFSPRNGEVILKELQRVLQYAFNVSVPAMGK